MSISLKVVSMAVSFFTATNLSLNFLRRLDIFSRSRSREATFGTTGATSAFGNCKTVSTSFLPIRFNPLIISSTERPCSFIISRATSVTFTFESASELISAFVSIFTSDFFSVFASASAFFSGFSFASAFVSTLFTTTLVSMVQTTDPTATLSPS